MAIPPPARCCSTASWTVGRGTRPTSITSQPVAVRPVATAAANAGPEARASRPSTTGARRPLPARSRTQAPNAAAQRVTTSGVRSLPTMPRTPATPTIKVSVIGRWVARCRKGPVPPAPFQTVRADFPHTAYRWCSRRQRARRRIPHGATQPVQAVSPEPFPRPRGRLTGTEGAPSPLHHEAVQPPVDVRVEVVELPSRITRAEIVGPAAQHGVQPADTSFHAFDPLPRPVGELLHPGSHPLHTPSCGPALKV